ncbi:MAG: TetR/AcrR family transcriptional regulator [Anaerolineales bacterium]|nr:TetR/AcrR family transcriptional regulator [Anaerolineales bacterium]
MARTVKNADARQTEILDTAQIFFYTKGYDNTAVRDIINDIGIAKGTFYHHFNSKEELLDALIDRLMEQALAILEPILDDNQLTALEKLHLFFGEVGNLKIENESFIRTLLPILYEDSNILMREKAKQSAFNMYTPLYNQIIQQGIAEGVFTVQYPNEMGGIIFQTMYFMSETLGRLLIENENKQPWSSIQKKIDAYNTTLDNMLGAAPGSIQLFDFEPFQYWFERP